MNLISLNMIWEEWCGSKIHRFLSETAHSNEFDNSVFRMSVFLWPKIWINGSRYRELISGRMRLSVDILIWQSLTHTRTKLLKQLMLRKVKVCVCWFMLFHYFHTFHRSIIISQMYYLVLFRQYWQFNSLCSTHRCHTVFKPVNDDDFSQQFLFYNNIRFHRTPAKAIHLGIRFQKPHK